MIKCHLLNYDILNANMTLNMTKTTYNVINMT